tara:strand:- start:2802 stop:3701 length:900 start_codon:yes stop_codon:yes gene_type:complete
MIIPQKMNFGDSIGIISTARKITRKELRPAVEILESWGLKVIFGKFLYEENNQFSGTVDQRVVDLQNMINDSSIKAVLFARGGYGTVQVIEKVNFSKLRENPKWIIGYSDITVLHSHLHQLGFATLHATMPINFSKNSKASLLSIKQAIFQVGNIIESTPHQFNRLGKVQSEVVGGNLSVLYSLLGSRSDLDPSGKILFIEDLDEYLYHVDRMVINMKRNGKFENLKAMIIGGMTDMNDNPIPFGKNAEEIILTYTEEYTFPICFGFPSGHLDDNRALILGVASELDINENGVSLSQYL